MTVYSIMIAVTPPKQYKIAGAGMQSTLNQTMCGALPTTNKAVTAVMVMTLVYVSMSKHHLESVPSGR
jgi:hypothetical protein